MRGPFWNILFYIFIGDTLASAINNGSKGMLIIAIVGALIGLIWLFPLFLPEDVNDKKL